MKVSHKYHTANLPLPLLRLLKRQTVYVRAAGGIVTAPDGTMLLIRRNNRWDLPKGKVESSETLLQAALRETLEETGVQATPVNPLPQDDRRPADASPAPQGQAPLPLPIKTYHLFRAPKAWLRGPNPPARKWHLKQTSWFPLTADKASATAPQQEEGITEVVWVAPDEWYRRLQSSYGTLKTLSDQWKHSAR